MVYLYAALGITMLTGVITMFEISSALINQQVLNSAPIDTYVQTIYQTNDRNFLRVLTHADSSWGSGDTLCTNLKLKATELEEDLFFNSEVIRDFNDFANQSEIIITNRMTEELSSYREKIYTRDLFGTDL